MQNLDEILSLATELALSAGDILKNGRMHGYGTVDTKSSSVDIVTEIDHESERFIVSAIQQNRPDDGILGEEGTSKASSNGIRWVVDPLDGTVNFTYGLPQYAVAIGVELNHVPVVGVVFNPESNELFAAKHGGGATLNGQPISANSETSLEYSLVATGFAYDANRRKMQAELVSQLISQVRDIRRLGSAAIDLCHVACGRVDAYYEQGIRPWDICGASVIAREAGAIVTSFNGTDPDDSVIAANPYLHKALQELIIENQQL